MATNILSPPTSGEGDVLSSLQSRRSRAIASSSPWTQIVRGADSATEIVVAPSSPSATCLPDWPTSKLPAPATSPSSCSAEDESLAEPPQTLTQTDDANAAKKPAWKKPSNGNGNGNNALAATAADVTPVMDNASWPALSACTKASPKSASSDSLKALAVGSVPPLQAIGVASLSPRKPVIGSNTNPNPTPSHVTTSRQRSIKRGSTNGGFIQPSPPPPPQLQVLGAETTPGKPGNTAGDSSSHKEGGQRGGRLMGNHQPQCSNSFNKRGSGGQHPRGDGSYHHNHGGRRDQDRGNQDWINPHQSFGGRDNHMQPQSGASRSFARGPHTSPAYIPPPVAVRPFGNPLVYPEVPPSLIYIPGPPPESLRGVPVMAPAHPLYFCPIPDPQLHARIVTQIDYYFSNENLIKDTFLRQNMDDQGWVPIKLIAGFKKVMLLTDNIQLILNAIQASTLVEVQNDKIRKRNEWMKWLMPPGPFSPVSSPQSLTKSSHDVLAGQFQGIELDENMHAHTEMFSRSSSGDLSSQLQQSGGESTVVAGSGRKMLVGNPSK